MKVEGGCLCGAVRFAIDVMPRSVHFCHCSMCRRATGGPFAVLAWFPEDRLSWICGEPTVHRSSPIAVRAFCVACGTPLFLRYDGAREVGVMVGALDEPEEFPPTYHYGVEGRLHWSDVGQGMPEKVTKETFPGHTK
jgi:hypothetical protein